jgi:hypothetical protein
MAHFNMTLRAHLARFFQLEFEKFSVRDAGTHYEFLYSGKVLAYYLKNLTSDVYINNKHPDLGESFRHKAEEQTILTLGELSPAERTV